jgi:hypothetical protein
MMEYRIEMIHFKGEGNRSDFLVQRLNEFGKEGWRVASVDLTPHAEFAVKSLAVLLERPTASDVKAKSAP